VSKRAETPSAATLVFDPEHWPGHRAGQHVDVRLTADDGYQAERSYSIASAPEDTQLELTVERLADGEVSGYLVDGMVPGDVLELRGPIGGWFAWDVADGGPLLLVAGGSGLVPLMAMLRHRRRRSSRVPTRLLVSVRTGEQLIYAGELRELAAAGDGFELFVTATRGEPLPGSALSGRVNRQMLAGVAWPGPGRGRAYVCGPTSFVEMATALLVELGYPARDIRAERFGVTRSIEGS
jgi:ferredoxin-NADP reductase